MSDGPVNRYATGKIFRAFAFSLRESKPSDYILLTGLTLMACIACSIFAVKHKTLNMLIFKPATHTYCERRMDLHDLEDFENEIRHVGTSTVRCCSSVGLGGSCARQENNSSPGRPDSTKLIQGWFNGFQTLES